MVGYGLLGHVPDTLDGALKQADYIAGSGFGAADVHVGSQLGWGMMVGAIDARPTFARYWHARYWQRLAERPAAQRAKEIDDALMPAKG